MLLGPDRSVFEKYHLAQDHDNIKYLTCALISFLDWDNFLCFTFIKTDAHLIVSNDVHFQMKTRTRSITVKNVLLNTYCVPNQLPLGNVYTSIGYFAEAD